MEFERFDDHYVLRLDTGEEVKSTLLDFAQRVGIGGGYFLAFGAFCRVRLRYFNYQTKAYEDHEVDQQVEVVSLMGNIACEDGSPRLHMHAAVGDCEGRTYSGHIGEGIVRPTLEVFLTKLPGEVRRRKDPDTGLSLLALRQLVATS